MSRFLLVGTQIIQVLHYRDVTISAAMCGRVLPYQFLASKFTTIAFTMPCSPVTQASRNLPIEEEYYV